MTGEYDASFNGVPLGKASGFDIATKQKTPKEFLWIGEFIPPTTPEERAARDRMTKTANEIREKLAFMRELFFVEHCRPDWRFCRSHASTVPLGGPDILAQEFVAFVPESVIDEPGLIVSDETCESNGWPHRMLIVKLVNNA